MTMHDFSEPFGNLSRNPEALPRGIVIVANEADIAALRGDQSMQRHDDISYVAMAADMPIASEMLSDTRLLVLEIEPGNPQSLRRISDVRTISPDLPIIAAIRDASVSLVRTLVRQGVSDVTQIPFRPAELVSQIMDATSLFAGNRNGSAELAPMVTVAGSSGGCGTTTVITHLAAELAQSDRFPRGVCVVDLDLQAGEVAYYVGQFPKVTVSALLDAGSRLDAELLRSVLTDSHHGFTIIAAPERITALDDVDADHLLRMLALIRKEFDCVLIDLPADWTGWALSVVLASDEVLFVTEPSIASLRQARRKLELFESIGVDEANVHLVVNGVERRLFRSIGIDEVREVLERDVMATLADEGDQMRSAQNEGKLITDLRRHSRFASDIKTLSRVVLSKGR